MGSQVGFQRSVLWRVRLSGFVEVCEAGVPAEARSGSREGNSGHRPVALMSVDGAVVLVSGRAGVG